MNKLIGILVTVLVLATGLVNSVNAAIIQKALPYDHEPIVIANPSDDDGVYGAFDWKNDGSANTTITGSVDTFSISGDAEVKIGIGNHTSIGGWLVFYADGTNDRKVYLEFSPGSVDSNIVDLADFTIIPPVYSFSITIDETLGTFDAVVTDMNGSYPLTHNKTFAISGVENRAFAVGITGDSAGKDEINAEISLVPEPGSLLLIVAGAGLLRMRRRR